MTRTSARYAPRYLGPAGLVAGLVATAALLSACGSSTKTGSVAAAGASTTSSAPSVAATPEVTSAAPLVSTSADAQASVAASLPAGTHADSKFCQIAKAEQDQSTQLASELSSGSQTQLKAFIQKAFAELPAFAAAAPDSIKADVQKLVDIDDKLFSALRANNYDFSKSQAGVQAAVSDPGFATAGAHVTSYLMTGCGLSASLPAASATP